MASHIQDQEELENFKYFWKSWGRWLFTALLIAALAYLLCAVSKLSGR